MTKLLTSQEIRDLISNEPETEKIRFSIHRKLDEILDGVEPGELITIAALPGSGKCHGAGTRVLMFDGSTKSVEDVAVGDLLMGDDSKKRKVLALGGGRGEMFKIIPRKGDAFSVNGDHILCLKNTYTKKIKEISVTDFLKIGKCARDKWKLYKVGIDFQEEDVELDPYFLGIWLGDGTSDNTQITTGDSEIINYLKYLSRTYGLVARVKKNSENSVTVDLVGKKGNKNPLREALRRAGVWENKHIPKNFLINSRENRLKLLAGLIDSDGYAGGKARSSGLGFSNKNKALFDDFVFLCRSLGLSVGTAIKHNKKYNKDYFVACVSGDCSVVPCLLYRKKRTTRKINKDALVTGFDVVPIGMGDYYGFQISGNGRYLLRDFIVTHNTSLCISFTKDIASNHKCLWFSCEMRPKSFLRMFGDDMPIFYMPDELKSFKTELEMETWMESVIKYGKEQKGIEAVFIDHLQYLTNLASDRTVQMVDHIMRWLKNVCIKYNVAIMLISHIGKDDGRDGRPGVNAMRGSQMIAGESDTVLIIQRLKEKSVDSFGDHPWSSKSRIYVEKNRRNGILGHVTMSYDLSARVFSEETPLTEVWNP